MSTNEQKKEVSLSYEDSLKEALLDLLKGSVYALFTDRNQTVSSKANTLSELLNDTAKDLLTFITLEEEFKPETVLREGKGEATRHVQMSNVQTALMRLRRAYQILKRADPTSLTEKETSLLRMLPAYIQDLEYIMHSSFSS